MDFQSLMSNPLLRNGLMGALMKQQQPMQMPGIEDDTKGGAGMGAGMGGGLLGMLGGGGAGGLLGMSGGGLLDLVKAKGWLK